MAKYHCPRDAEECQLVLYLKKDSTCPLGEDELSPLLLCYHKQLFLPGELASVQPSLRPLQLSPNFASRHLGTSSCLRTLLVLAGWDDSFPLFSPCFINCHTGGFDLPWNQALPNDLLYCSTLFHIISRESCAVGNDQAKETHEMHSGYGVHILYFHKGIAMETFPILIVPKPQEEGN